MKVAEFRVYVYNSPFKDYESIVYAIEENRFLVWNPNVREFVWTDKGNTRLV